MFEPLPGLVRLRREQRNITQAQLAEKAGINRGQLIAFEQGRQNVTLKTLLKIARALEMTELPLAELHLRPAEPEVTALVAAADALAIARGVTTSAAAADGQMESLSRIIGAMVERARRARDMDSTLVEVAERLALSSANDAATQARTNATPKPKRR